MDVNAWYLILGNLFCLETAYENLASNKPTWQRYPVLSEPWGSDRAVDGRFSNLSQYGGQCAISFNAETAEWRVDLGVVSGIHHVNIHFAQGMNPWGENNKLTAVSLGFSVYVSNTTDKENGVLCFKDTKYTSATIPNPVSVSCPFHGRYIFYYNNRTHPPYPSGYSTKVASDLCEVQVYGCKQNGYYGEKCSLKCPENCQEGHCDIVYGRCLGCVVGFQGERCQENCTRNTYGMQCDELCGLCKNGDQCDHVTGNCPMGCDSGRYGVKCDKGNCTDCVAGTFGENCYFHCGHCLGDEPCNFVNGSCVNGCSRGYWGYQCNVSVDDVFSIFSLDNPLAVPLYSVFAVCSFSVAVSIILCIKRRKTRHVQSESHTEEPTYMNERQESEVQDTAYDELENGKNLTYELVY